MITKTVFFNALLLCLAARSVAEGRTWTDRSGKLTVEAEFVAVEPGRVWLRRDDGQTFEIALIELSAADQHYVAELVRKQKSEVVTELPGASARIHYGPGRLLAELADRRISESSGLACSRRTAGLFWTHNDSGDAARIYLFDTAGRDRGSCLLSGVFAYDWEDIVSFEAGGKQLLVVCDVGNNGRAAAVQMLHVVEEPCYDPEQGLQQEQVPLVQTIFFAYEDDYRDCEAVAVDATDKTILLVTKERGVGCRAYALPWPATAGNQVHVAKLIGMLKIPSATGMDVSPDGRRAVVSTYESAYEYDRSESENWREALAKPPREIALPKRRQGESICYGVDGKTLYLTSERLPTPLWEVPPIEQRGNHLMQ